ncbi:MAG: valine--tRNA ligase [Acidobacteriota bacterium]
MSDTSANQAQGMVKGYEPGAVEKRWSAVWEQQQVHVADNESSATPFSMVIPPPNVTGELHMGHALEHTLHDIVVRWHRMTGEDVLWLPGTDHAGIATQITVERALAEEGKDRFDLGREEFEAKVWSWKEEYGGRILEQMKRMGLTCDWSRLRFTLDEGLSRAVRKVFVALYEDGLVYRGEYLVNWCPRCDTALSELEVEHREVDGKLWKIRYPLVDSADEYLEVDTTRPETMLGDTALAVHPDDDRYSGLVGQEAVLPVIGRRLPVVADDFVDPEFGTGVVKVTPAHDPNDYEAGRRHDLEVVQVIGRDGRMTEAAGPYAGQERFEARRGLLEQLEQEGYLTGDRQHRHAVGHCDRCDTVIEPQISTQWFVRMKPLAEPALEAVEEGRIRFHPENQVRIYREWMTNIRDWCISRQLWWGHRIPAWYCEDCDETVVAEQDPDECPACGGALRQDPDVLDTWFSSALFPFSTLGWPDETRDLERYYPTDLLINGYDILFFWDARMIMMGLRFMGDVPFREILLHGLVRDEHGHKMSKTRGNGIDPLELIDEYGADATRFTLAAMSSPGSDIRLSMDRVAGYRTFCNKLWNAARFALLNLGDQEEALGACGEAADPKPESLADRWILSRTAAMVPALEEDLSRYRFDEACHRLYQFVWHEFCDWYLEMTKVVLNGEDDAAKARTRGTLLSTLELLLRALHPVIPFITEEIWSRLPGARGLLAVSPWAATQPEWHDPEAEATVQLMREVGTEARRLRADVGIDPRRTAPLVLVTEDEDRRDRLADAESYLAALVHADPLDIVERAAETGPAVSGVVGEVQVLIPLEGVVDLERERRRLASDLEQVKGDLEGLSRRLDNPGFVDNAPEEVVAKTRDRMAELEAEREQLETRIEQVGG